MRARAAIVGWGGVAAAAVGILAVGMHHFRCVAIVSSDPAQNSSIPCVETFPGVIAEAGLVLVVIASLAALVSAFVLARRVAAEGARVAFALAAALLLLPAALVLAGWASVGFDLGTHDTSRGCRGKDLPPLWLQTPTCIPFADLLLVPALALGGSLASASAWRAGRGAAMAGFAVATAALGLAGLALAIGHPASSWHLPGALGGTALLGVGLVLGRSRSA